MTSDTLFTFLYDWIDKIINIEPTPPPSPLIPIISAYDEGTVPDTKYISINPDPNSKMKIGSPSTGDPQENVDPNLDGRRILVNDYELSVELRQVGGGNDFLRQLIDSVDRQEIKDLFSANNVTYYEESAIQYAPSLQGAEWRQETFVELRLGTAEGTTENASYIDDVEGEGTVPAQGRSGDHTLTI